MTESQIAIPPSFVALHLRPGRSRPDVGWEVLAERYELCEDMAQMLTEHAQQLLVRLGVAEADVLGKVRQALLAQEEGRLDPPEVGWAVCRLAELLGWRWGEPVCPASAAA